MTERSEIITIAGPPGSGKSTTAKMVAARLDFEHFSSGDLFRAASKEQGKTVLEANLAAEQVADGIPAIDALVDQRLREIGEQQTRLVIDSRTAWHWIPDSFKVFFDLELDVAAQRILNDMTPERIAAEHIPSNPEEYALQLEARLASESRRYKKLYGIDPYQTSNYDLVVDTKQHNLETVAGLIIEGYQRWRDQK
jgi:cytidylate kinase